MKEDMYEVRNLLLRVANFAQQIACFHLFPYQMKEKFEFHILMSSGEDVFESV